MPHILLQDCWACQICPLGPGTQRKVLHFSNQDSGFSTLFPMPNTPVIVRRFLKEKHEARRAREAAEAASAASAAAPEQATVTVPDQEAASKPQQELSSEPDQETSSEPELATVIVPDEALASAPEQAMTGEPDQATNWDTRFAFPPSPPLNPTPSLPACHVLVTFRFVSTQRPPFI